MKYAQWGLNPVFEPEPGFSGEIHVDDKDMGRVDLKFDLRSDERTTHFGLRARATTVFPVESKRLSSLPQERTRHNKSNELVAKLYWPEGSRQSDPDIWRKCIRLRLARDR